MGCPWKRCVIWRLITSPYMRYYDYKGKKTCVTCSYFAANHHFLRWKFYRMSLFPDSMIEFKTNSILLERPVIVRKNRIFFHQKFIDFFLLNITFFPRSKVLFLKILTTWSVQPLCTDKSHIKFHVELVCHVGFHICVVNITLLAPVWPLISVESPR